MDVKACWLTVNRMCNLRCNWCYAKLSNYNANDNMELPLFEKLVNIACDLGVERYLLIGGEPTIHPSFFEFLKVLREKSIVIVSNGIKMADKEFCKKMVKLKPDISIDISLKGASNDEYYINTGKAAFDLVIKAIHNLNDLNIKHSISYVITLANIQFLHSFFQAIRKADIKERINLAFCNPSITLDGKMDSSCKCETQVHIAAALMKEYPYIKHENFAVMDTCPICLQDCDFINELIKSQKVSTGCHVHSRRGLIFDTKGEILLCNSLVGFNIGTFGIDYFDSKSLAAYWDSEKITKLYKLLSNLPSKNCINCEKKQYCAGGCCIQYLNNSFEELKLVYELIKKEEVK
jgi:radical SAM protein with 4Fe4S-binding SPASM domain